MKAVLWLLLGLVIGGFVGWYVRGDNEQVVHAQGSFTFLDKLADPLPVLIARGTWRGASLANKVNTVRIMCDALEKTCNMSEAEVSSWTGDHFLYLNDTSLAITKLDDQSLIAETVPPDLCIHQTLTFNRVAKAVTYVRTKINREDVCSGVQEEPVTLFLDEPPLWRSIRQGEKYPFNSNRDRARGHPSRSHGHAAEPPGACGTPS